MRELRWLSNEFGSLLLRPRGASNSNNIRVAVITVSGTPAFFACHLSLRRLRAMVTILWGLAFIASLNALNRNGDRSSLDHLSLRTVIAVLRMLAFIA